MEDGRVEHRTIKAKYFNDLADNDYRFNGKIVGSDAD